ncbi:MAG: InlB B-repeat-containing protein [Clostridia bacterium]|nr:InlB B-repeat-containing protein [Clostridia bacterium]
MKRNIFKVALVLVIVLCFVLALTACKKGDGTHEVIVKYGDDILVTLNVADGTKAELPADKQTLAGGYGFVGLFSDPELTQSFTGEITSDMILYAKFVRSPKFILIDSNGAPDIDAVMVYPGDTYTLTAPDNYPGHTFVKYTRLTEDGRTVDFPLTGTFEGNNNVQIKANWSKNKYTVTLHCDGEEDEVISNVEFDATISLSSKEKVGYKFNGWFEKNADGTFAAEKFDVRTRISSDLDLTARFTANTYTIAFAANGGSEVSNLTVTYDAAYDLSSRIPQKAGYSFDKFLLDDEEFPQTGKYTFTRDIRLKATYTINTYTVTFKDAEENAYGAAQTLEYGASETAPVAAAGYHIEGVYTDKTFAAASKVDFATYKVSGDATLYVNALPNTYTITVINGNNVQVNYNAAYALPDKATLEADLPEKWSAFNGYKWNDKSGDAFAATGTYEWARDIVVYADYAQNPMWEKSTVVFMDGNTKLDEKVVDNGSNIAALLLTIDTDKEGYTFSGWCKKSDLSSPFNAATETIGEDTILYAKYNANQYTVSFSTGSESAFDSVKVTYNEEYDLSAYVPEKRGYEFKYWTVGGQQIPTKAIFEQTTDVTLVAYYERTMVTVTFMNGVIKYDEVTIGQYETMKGRMPANPTKIGARFLGWLIDKAAFSVDAEVEEDIELTADFEAILYEMTIYRTEAEKVLRYYTYGQAYDLGDISTTRAGYSFVAYEFDGEVFEVTGTYDYDYSINVYGVWNATANLENEGNYFVETLPGEAESTLVLLTDVTYTFDGYDSVEVLEKYAGAGYLSNKDESGVALAANKLRATAIGTPSDLTITLKRDGNPDVVKKVKVAAYIDSMGDGSNLNAMLTNSINKNLFMNPLGENRGEAAANCVLEVGVADFRPDLLIKTYGDKAAALTLTKAEMIVTVTDSKAKAIHAFSVENNRIDFDSTILDNYDADEVFTVSFVPKYNINGFAPYLMKVKLNDGKNVYTSKEMKEAYADLSVHKINVLANITAALTTEDYYTDLGGTTQNVQEVALINGDGTPRNITVDTGTPKNGFNYGVYARHAGADDSLVINGNYFEIDGSKLPYIDNSHDKYGKEGSEYTVGAGYRIANVQSGIFLYRSGEYDYNGEQIKKYATGTLSINNLRIGGNNIYDSDVQQDLKDGNTNKLLKMSAAYIGMVVRGGTVNASNVSIKNTSMAFMLHGSISGYKFPGLSEDSTVMYAVQPGETQATKLYADGMIMDNSWANSIYCYDLTYMSLLNTKIGRSCGLAIHCDDRPYGGNAEGSLGYSNLNCELLMDSYTATNLNNWIVGDEAWFIAYGMSEAALGAKTALHDGVQAASSNILGVINTGSGEEKMNFAILGKPVDLNSTAAWKADKDNFEPKEPKDWTPTPHVDVHVLDGGFLFFYKDDSELAALGAALLPELESYTNNLAGDPSADYAALMSIEFTKVEDEVLKEDSEKETTFRGLVDEYTGYVVTYATTSSAEAYAAAMGCRMNMLLMYYEQLIADYGSSLQMYQYFVGKSDAVNAGMAYNAAMSAYGRLIKLGRPYVSQTVSGMQVVIPVYYVHEMLSGPAA